MNLKRVTLTGADDDVDIQAFAELHDAHPLLEPTFLLSETRTGRVPRYPSLRWLSLVRRFLPPPYAVHLCGSWARRAAEGEPAVFDFVQFLLPEVGRVQLNLDPKTCRSVVDPQRIRETIAGRTLQVIVQASSFGRTENLGRVPVGTEANLLRLQDVSGGRGRRGTFEAPPDGRQYLGYAGGIGPDNVVAVLDEIAAFDAPNDFWIDMETGVRDMPEDRFNLTKAREVLEKVESWQANPLCAPRDLVA